MIAEQQNLSFLRLPAVQRKVPYSKSSIYTMIAAGQFPAPYRLGGRAVAWLERDVDDFIRRRLQSEPDIPKAPRPPVRTTRSK
ncbi:helix-turn-helix transcriptional regulator [Tunturiibacter gelidoferens]|uniref:helix-turn-helix transcriptional regulator n=1 Tax=Tunturiibacter gelidiferens TaxID=3069689 RepID=UPI001619B8B2|nr:AlpA family phage regulatory protein [Edaphobacter lichenicola]